MRMVIVGSVVAAALIAAGGSAEAKINCNKPSNCTDPAVVADARGGIEVACPCAGAASRKSYKSCTKTALRLAKTRLGTAFTKACEKQTKQALGNSTCGRAGFVTCNKRNRADTRTTCKVVKAAKCKGSACGAFTSCADACNPSGESCPTTSSTSTTTSSTSTTIPPEQCCSAFTQLSFTTGTGSGECGTTVNGTGVLQTSLTCGNLYVGTGSSGLPGAPTPDQGTTITSITNCDPGNGDLTIGSATAGETGSNENCSAAGCLFGGPLPIPNPTSTPTSTCVINVVGTAGASGTGNALTGAVSAQVPLDSNVYLVGDLLDGTAVDRPAVPGIQPCPLCVAGSCGSGTCCQGGPNHGNDCVPDTGSPGPVQYPTSHDCPPPPGGFLNTLAIPFALSSGTVQETAANTDGTGGLARVFCGWCRDANTTNGFGLCTGGTNPGTVCQFASDCTGGGTCGGVVRCTSNADCPTDLCDNGVTPCHNDADCLAAGASACNMDTGARESCQQRDNGAFGKGAANTITEVGTPAGNMCDGAGHPTTLVSIFCIPPTFDGSVDGAGGLPGPGAVSLPGQGQLLP